MAKTIKHRVKNAYTRSGYTIAAYSTGSTSNGIIINDNNLYPDSDYRSTERREFVVVTNDIDDLESIGKAILKLCKKCRKNTKKKLKV